MSLLTAAQIAEIRSAVILVTDTFMITPITYYAGGEQFSRSGEGQDSKVFTKYILNALVEYFGDTKEEYSEGSKDDGRVKLTFNVDTLPVGVLNADLTTSFVIENDYFKLKNRVYKVDAVYFDGPLEVKDVLLLIEGSLQKTAVALPD